MSLAWWTVIMVRPHVTDVWCWVSVTSINIMMAQPNNTINQRIQGAHVMVFTYLLVYYACVSMSFILFVYKKEKRRSSELRRKTNNKTIGSRTLDPPPIVSFFFLLLVSCSCFPWNPYKIRWKLLTTNKWRRKVKFRNEDFF